jgi:hypothetical protein
MIYFVPPFTDALIQSIALAMLSFADSPFAYLKSQIGVYRHVSLGAGIHGYHHPVFPTIQTELPTLTTELCSIVPSDQIK